MGMSLRAVTDDGECLSFEGAEIGVSLKFETLKDFGPEGVADQVPEIKKLLAGGKFPEGLTFDDVLLKPAASAVMPGEVDTRTRLTRDIEIFMPIISAASISCEVARMALPRRVR